MTVRIIRVFLLVRAVAARPGAGMDPALSFVSRRGNRG